MPAPIQQLPEDALRHLDGVFCDIDDTLTWEGQLVEGAFGALHRAQAAGLKVIPITGRPGGWVDHLARMWPVDGVVGENGGLWFWMEGGRMHRRFHQTAEARRHIERLASGKRSCNLEWTVIDSSIA